MNDLDSSYGDAPDQLDGPNKPRRERLLEATIDMMMELDYPAIQMKGVTARTGVALRTIYRYFASKDHLLSEALMLWASRYPMPTSPYEGCAEDQVNVVFKQAARAFQNHPNLYRTMAHIQASKDPWAQSNFRVFSTGQIRVFERYLTNLGQQRSAGVVAVMSAVLDVHLRIWAMGQQSLDDVYRHIDEAAALLVGPRPTDLSPC